MQLQEMSWPAVGAVSKDIPVVVPIAAVEQHGPHLPVFTDSMLLGEVVRRAADLRRSRGLDPAFLAGEFAPPPRFRRHPLGGAATYLDVLGDLIDNLVVHGFRRVVLLNGHGGNIVPAQQAVFEARQRYRHADDLLLLAATYWLLGGKPDGVDPRSRRSDMGHACEWETSMILHLRRTWSAI